MGEQVAATMGERRDTLIKEQAAATMSGRRYIHGGAGDCHHG